MRGVQKNWSKYGENGSRRLRLRDGASPWDAVASLRKKFSLQQQLDLFPNTTEAKMKTATLHFLLIAAILQLLVSAPSSLAQLEDNDENCQGWADNGECSLNPKYMLENW